MKIQNTSNNNGSFFNLKRKILIFLAVFGPATITAISDNDAAGVATYSLAGSQFGYSILFILLIVTILLAVTQEMGVRIAMITGKGLGDLIRERYGIRVSMLVFLCLFIANQGTVIANFSALKAVTILLNIPSIPILIFFVILSIVLISKGNYKTNQRIFLVGMVLYFSYVISAFKAGPDWGLALKSIILPTNIILTKEFVLASIAVLGTTITPWGQFFINSFVIDKKLHANRVKYVQLETFFGAFLTDFFSFFMIVATAATLFVNGIPLVSGEQAALAIRPFAGHLASVLFSLGLINAALMGILIVSLSTAYAFAEFFGVEGSLDAPLEKGKLFYGIFIFQVIIAFLVVCFPSISLFSIVFITQSVNGVLLPFIFFFLLKITNNKDLMGEHVNKPAYNYFVVIASIVIILAAIFTVVSNIIHI